MKKIALLFPLSCAIIILSRVSIFSFSHLNTISLYNPLQTITILLMMISILLIGNIRFELNKTLVYLIGFLSFAGLSTLFSLNFEFASSGLFYMIRISLMSFLVYLFLNEFWSLDFNRILIKILFWSGMLGAISVVAVLFLDTGGYSYMGIMGEVNQASGMLAVLLPFGFYQVFETQERYDLLKVIIYNICCIIIVIAILVSGSRMGIIISAFSILMVLIIKRHHLLTPKFILVLVCNIIIIYVLYIAIINEGLFLNLFELLEVKFSGLWYVVGGETLPYGSSVMVRQRLFFESLRVFLEHPFWGIGLGNTNYIVSGNSIQLVTSVKALSPHNEFVTILSDIGLFGFVFYVFLFVQIGKNLYFLYKISRDRLYLYLYLSFLNLCTGLFFLTDHYNHYLWGMFIPLSMYIDSKKQRWKLSHKFDET